MHLHEWYGCVQSIQHGLLSNLAHKNGRCHRIRAVCSRTCHLRHSVTDVPTCVGAEMRVPAVSRGAATTREGRMKPHARENHGPQPNCRRPSVHQQNAREKTPVHAHGANNHTMDTTDTYNPLKLRWHALTWKPTANGEHPTKQRDASQFLRCRTKDTHTTTDLVNEPTHQKQFLTFGETQLCYH